MDEPPKIGTIEWVKSLSDDAIDTLKPLLEILKECDGWYSDECFDLEHTINSFEETVQREHMYRVGIALGISPEKVNKTVGYLMGD